ncbi:hypothetical protein [Pseudomonas citronellolis]|uniref:hypothetical protein n=1 Tax=Pseudomonas citronellolis TaxID=53408 RepID=UPI0007789193|nr:hypothetical protein [Pseudomonas citronellolis]AMO78659.1 hypothetical protein PcP3B5_52760 [Pseudomonas citronellolis]
MTTAENWKAFDLAEWCLDLMISHYARQIHAERQRPEPDYALIASWQLEQGRLDDERDALRIEDQANNERVLRAYGPLARTPYKPRPA